MNNIMEYLIILGIGDYTRLHFYYFLDKYEFLVIMGIITLALTLISRKTIAIVIQLLLFVGLWLNSWSSLLFQVFFGNSGSLHTFDIVITATVIVLQVLVSTLILLELKSQLR